MASAENHNGPSTSLTTSDVTVKDVIVDGSVTKLHVGLFRQQQVSIKVWQDVEGMDKTKEQKRFEAEVAILQSVRSPSLVYFYGTLPAGPLKRGIVYEYPKHGTLFEYLHNESSPFDFERMGLFAISIVSGLVALHNWAPAFLHRNLKSANVWLDTAKSAKLADYGSDEYNLLSLGNAGAYAYTAPETYRDNQFTDKSDIFAVGTLLWEMVVRVIRGRYEAPYSEYKQFTHEFQILIQVAEKGLRPTIPEGCPKPLEDIIRACWHSDPALRPSAVVLRDSLENQCSFASWKKK